MRDGRFDLADDYTAPLGLDRDRPRRSRRLWPLVVVAGLIAAIGVGAWSMRVSAPPVTQSIVRLAPPPPALEVAPAPAAAPPIAVAPEPPDDPSGQIVIRDP
jgi:hypothetical protein